MGLRLVVLLLAAVSAAAEGRKASRALEEIGRGSYLTRGQLRNQMGESEGAKADRRAARRAEQERKEEREREYRANLERIKAEELAEKRMDPVAKRNRDSGLPADMIE